MDAMGPDGFLVYLAAIHVAIAAFGVYRMTRRPSPGDQYPHVLTPTQPTPVAASWEEEWAHEREGRG